MALRPDYPRACNNLGTALRLQDQWEEAITYFQRAAKLQHDFADAYVNLGKALIHEGRTYEAENVFRKLIELRPDQGEAHFDLGCTLRLNYQHEQAVEEFTKAVALNPESIAARNNLAAALNHLGRLDEALAVYGEVLKMDPSLIAIDSNRLFTMQFHPGYDSQAILRHHIEWNIRQAEPLASQILPHDNDPDPTRRLRIGYLSPDFKNHCQQFFTVPVLSNHHHDGFEIFCYADVRQIDDVTTVLRGYADVWRDINAIEYPEIVKRIRRRQDRHSGGSDHAHGGLPAARLCPQARTHPDRVARLSRHNRHADDGLSPYRSLSRSARRA